MIPSAQGVQAWDRYAYANNNPVRYNDPTGHQVDEGDEGSHYDAKDACARNGYNSPECGQYLNLPEPPPPSNLEDIVPKVDDATQEPELTSPEDEVDMAEMAAGAVLVLLVEGIAIALAVFVGFTSSATGPLAILAAYKTFELVNAVLAPIAFIGIGMMIHAAVKDDL